MKENNEKKISSELLGTAAKKTLEIGKKAFTGVQSGVSTVADKSKIAASNVRVGVANAIEKLLVDKELYKKMSKESVKIFNEKFTAQVMTKNTEAVYLKVLEGK